MDRAKCCPRFIYCSPNRNEPLGAAFEWLSQRLVENYWSQGDERKPARNDRNELKLI